MHYASADPGIHHEDGFREYVHPEVGENQRLGPFVFWMEEDVVTREVYDLSPEEIEERTKNQVLAQAEGARESKIQEVMRQKVEAEFQAVVEPADILAIQDSYPIWENLEDGFAFGVDFKVQALEGVELKVFRIIQPHAKQSDRHPSLTPALWTKIEISGGVEVWAQPTGGDGKYPFIDPLTGNPYRVSHLDNIWVNTVPAPTLNVWEPGVYGWEEEV